MNDAGWLQLSLYAGAVDAERLEDALLAAGALAVTLADADDDPVLEPAPSQTPLWPRTRVTGLFDGVTDPALLRIRLAALLGEDALSACAPAADALPDRDWERAWLDDFRPMRFGERLWICPTAVAPPAPDAVNVMLDPGLAFGSGTHPTTALCLRWLDGAALDDKTLLDYGCGSGVLAVAAALLGVAEAHAADIDPQALIATRNNAAANGVGGRVTAYMPEALPARCYDVVVANILAAPLIALAERLAQRVLPGGRLVLSGLLEEQADAVVGAYRSWIDFAPAHVDQGWARLTGVRRGL